jgi:Ala-tRNA(Pro) deacylase
MAKAHERGGAFQTCSFAGKEREMAVVGRLQRLLERHHIPYCVTPHVETFTAKQTVDALCIPGQKMAKTVIVKACGRYVMLVLPAEERIDLAKVAGLLDANTVRLATETEMHALFPDCEIGATPPFGGLYDVEEWVDHSMIQMREIVCDAGTHREAVTLKTGDFMALAHPTVANFHDGAAGCTKSRAMH